MIVYYDPALLDSTKAVCKSYPFEGAVLAELDDLYRQGFTSCTVDDKPMKLSPCETDPNDLYLRLYKNTKNPLWLKKIDKGKLLTPVKLLSDTESSNVVVHKGNTFYLVAFTKDFDAPAFSGYTLVRNDRTAHFLINNEYYL